MAHIKIREKEYSESLPQKEQTPKPPTKVLGWTSYATMISLAIGVKIWQPLAIANSKQPDGSYTYNKSAMVLLVEITKLLLCSSILLVIWFQTPSGERLKMVNLPFIKSLHFLVPSLLYATSNTLMYLGLSYINPALFHVFGNIRIIITGVLARVMLSKKLTDFEWVALILLTIGAILSNIDKSQDPSKSDSNATGMFILTVMCLCSTSSSIYTEKYYKKTEELSIFYENCVMYIYGILVNGIFILLTESWVFEEGLTHGFDSAAFWVLISQSTMGVILSFIFKFLDNLVYVFSLTISMVLTAIISSVFFGFEFSLGFICAILIISVAIYLYYRETVLDGFKLDRNIRI